MKTLKSLRDLKACKVKRIVLGKTVDEQREELKALILANELPLEEFKEDDQKFTFREHFWFKNRLTGETLGEVVFRSRDYIFKYEEKGLKKESYGVELKLDNVTDYGFKIIDFKGNEIQYHIINE
jgi:hypothetical protein